MKRASEPAKEPDSERLVWSWNEWDPLEEIVVGTADGAYFNPTEPGYQPKIPDPHLQRQLLWPRGPKHPDVIDAAQVQLEGLVQALESEGVIVRRPKPLDFGRAVHTPDFEVVSGGLPGCAATWRHGECGYTCYIVRTTCFPSISTPTSYRYVPGSC